MTWSNALVNHFHCQRKFLPVLKNSSVSKNEPSDELKSARGEIRRRDEGGKYRRYISDGSWMDWSVRVKKVKESIQRVMSHYSKRQEAFREPAVLIRMLCKNRNTFIKTQLLWTCFDQKHDTKLRKQSSCCWEACCNYNPWSELTNRLEGRLFNIFKCASVCYIFL